MLKVGAQSFGFKRCPERELGHGSSLNAPVGELIRVAGVSFLLFLDGGAVDEG